MSLEGSSSAACQVNRLHGAQPNIEAWHLMLAAPKGAARFLCRLADFALCLLPLRRLFYLALPVFSWFLWEQLPRRLTPLKLQLLSLLNMISRTVPPRITMEVVRPL